MPGAPEATKVTNFDTHRPSFANDNLFQLLQQNGVVVNAKLPGGSPLWRQLLVGLLPTLLLVGLLLWGARGLRSAAGLGGTGTLGRSRARRYDPDTAPRVTFHDVAASTRCWTKSPRSSAISRTLTGTDGSARACPAASC